MRTLRRNLMKFAPSYQLLNSITKEENAFGYITLNYKANEKTKYVMKAVGSTPHIQIGYVAKTGNVYYRFWEYNNRKYYTIQNKQLTLPVDSDNVFEAGTFYLKCLSNGATVSGEITEDDLKYSINLPLYIFSPFLSKFKVSFYFLKIYEDNTLLYDLVPVQRKNDKVIGLLNRCDGKFYASVENSEFIVEYKD